MRIDIVKLFRSALLSSPVLLLSLTTPSLAQETDASEGQIQAQLQQSAAVERSMLESAAASQGKVDKSSDAALSLQQEIDSLQTELTSLAVYRDHLQGMIASQELEIRSYNQQLDSIDDTRQGVVPLMYQMLDGLREQINTDRPIRPQVRQQRLAQLQQLMVQADVSDAEKYRRILEAYQIEFDYGNKLGTFEGEIVFEQSTLQVEQLYLGRVVLLARSLDQAHYWSWDQAQQGWLALDRQAGLNAAQAYAVAHKSAAPSLLELPVSLVEAK